MQALVSYDLLSLPPMPFSRQTDIIPRYLALWSHLDKGDSPGRQATRPVPPVLWHFMSCSWGCLCGTYSVRKEWVTHLPEMAPFLSIIRQARARETWLYEHLQESSQPSDSVCLFKYIFYVLQVHSISATEGNEWRRDSLQLNCKSYILNTLYTHAHSCTHTHTQTFWLISCYRVSASHQKGLWLHSKHLLFGNFKNCHRATAWTDFLSQASAVIFKQWC